jgi:hypothetical protein
MVGVFLNVRMRVDHSQMDNVHHGREEFCMNLRKVSKVRITARPVAVMDACSTRRIGIDA